MRNNFTINKMFLGHKRRILIIIYSFILSFSFLYSPLPAFAKTQPDLTADTFMLMEMESGQVLAEKNADQRWSPASTTKIMTALIALDKANLDEEMTASDHAINSVGYDYVTAGIQVGETLKFETLLDLMMITSANEASNIIAEGVADDRTIQGFAQLMNEKAAELGLTGTHFVNPNGTEDENHYSTARDLANLGREAMKVEKFREVVGRTEFTLPDTNLRKHDAWKTGHLAFTNQLLKSRSQYYSMVTGIKTGYTDLAGRCLVSSAVNPDGLELIAVVLGADSYDTLYDESQKLLEYGYQNFSMQELVPKGKYMNRFEVADAVEGKKLEVITESGITRILPIDEAEREKDLQVIKTYNEPFAAPLTQGQAVGKLEYVYKGQSIGTVDLVAKDSIEKTTIAIVRDKYKEIVNDKRFVFGVKAAVILILVIIILSYILRMINRKHHRRKRYSDSYSKRNNRHHKNYR